MRRSDPVAKFYLRRRAAEQIQEEGGELARRRLAARRGLHHHSASVRTVGDLEGKAYALAVGIAEGRARHQAGPIFAVWDRGSGFRALGLGSIRLDSVADDRAAASELDGRASVRHPDLAFQSAACSGHRSSFGAGECVQPTQIRRSQVLPLAIFQSHSRRSVAGVVQPHALQRRARGGGRQTIAWPPPGIWMCAHFTAGLAPIRCDTRDRAACGFCPSSRRADTRQRYRSSS